MQLFHKYTLAVRSYALLYFVIVERGRRKPKTSRDAMTSLNVASLKRLLPIGLNMFGGQEQELVQQAKGRLIEVGNTF